jgi:hypothetical protein
MDTIKIQTSDLRDLIFTGRDFQAMLRLVKAIPGARFNGPSKTWSIPSPYKDLEHFYGPLAALREISIMEEAGKERKRRTHEQTNDLLDTQRGPWGLALSEAYRAGRDGEAVPDFERLATEIIETELLWTHSDRPHILATLQEHYEEGRHITNILNIPAKHVLLACGDIIAWHEWGGPGAEGAPFDGCYAYCEQHGDTIVTDFDGSDLYHAK